MKQLTTAAERSNKLKKALVIYKPLLEAAANKKPVAGGSALAKAFTVSAAAREKKREGVVDKLLARSKAATGKRKAAYELLVAEVKKGDSLAAPLKLIRDGIINLDSDKISTLRLLIDSANEREDLSTLTGVLADNALQALSTSVRKAIQEIDYLFFGPQSGS